MESVMMDIEKIRLILRMAKISGADEYKTAQMLHSEIAEYERKRVDLYNEILNKDLGRRFEISWKNGNTVVYEEAMRQSSEPNPTNDPATEPQQSELELKSKSEKEERFPLLAMKFGMTVEKVYEYLKSIKAYPGMEIPAYEIVKGVLGELPPKASYKRACTNFLERIPGIESIRLADKKPKPAQTLWGRCYVLLITERALLPEAAEKPTDTDARHDYDTDYRTTYNNRYSSNVSH